MKKIVPFKKEISFDTNIYEIDSISLEHTLSLKEDRLISGNFIISGTYKMTESSVSIDEFNYNLPFDISVDSKYDISNLTVDINDFYYEVINNKTLFVSIDVAIDGLEKKEETQLELVTDENEENKKDVRNEKNIIENNEEKIENTEENIVTSIFEELECDEKYVTYKIHIVNENDTLEKILQDYNISREIFENYNNASGIKIGDKLIIPSND